MVMTRGNMVMTRDEVVMTRGNMVLTRITRMVSTTVGVGNFQNQRPPLFASVPALMGLPLLEVMRTTKQEGGSGDVE